MCRRGGDVRDVGEIENVHDEPDCVTVTVWPAIVMSVRRLVAVLVVALKVDGSRCGSARTAGHRQPTGVADRTPPQPDAAVTAVVDEPADAVSVREVGDTPKVQLDPTLRHRDRLARDREGACASGRGRVAVALKVTVRSPRAAAAPLIVSQAALLRPSTRTRPGSDRGRRGACRSRSRARRGRDGRTCMRLC